VAAPNAGMIAASRQSEVDKMQKGETGVSRRVRSSEKNGLAARRQSPLLKGAVVQRGRERGPSRGGTT
jgi:hypothetical protein